MGNWDSGCRLQQDRDSGSCRQERARAGARSKARLGVWRQSLIYCVTPPMVLLSKEGHLESHPSDRGSLHPDRLSGEISPRDRAVFVHMLSHAGTAKTREAFLVLSINVKKNRFITNNPK